MIFKPWRGCPVGCHVNSTKALIYKEYWLNLIEIINIKIWELQKKRLFM